MYVRPSPQVSEATGTVAGQDGRPDRVCGAHCNRDPGADCSACTGQCRGRRLSAYLASDEELSDDDAAFPGERLQEQQQEDEGQELSPQKDQEEQQQQIVCAICLDTTLTTPCVPDVCSHVFCLPCLVQWCDVQACCPLCKAAPIRTLLWDIKSARVFRTFNVARDANRQTRRLLLHLAAADPVEARRHVYSARLRAVPLASAARRADVSCLVFQRDRQRIRAFVDRELAALLPAHLRSLVSTFVMRLLVCMPLDDDTLAQRLQPYLFDDTDAFLYEVTCFAASQYSVKAYDRLVRYHPRQQRPPRGPADAETTRLPPLREFQAYVAAIQRADMLALSSGSHTV